MTKERSLLMEVGKHVWEKSITLPPELAARILDWYREPPDEPGEHQFMESPLLPDPRSRCHECGHPPEWHSLKSGGGQ